METERFKEMITELFIYRMFWHYIIALGFPPWGVEPLGGYKAIVGGGVGV